MDNDHPIVAALTFIDVHLFEPITLEEIAAAAGLSPYHFSRLFAVLIGDSVMSYVRGRRLGAAARRLIEEPDVKLIDLALDSGFDSQEAFTRAFKRAFALTPGEFRRRRNEPLSYNLGDMTMNTNVPISLTATQQPVSREKFKVAGLSAKFGVENRSDIPKLWDRLIPRLPPKGPNGRKTYGVCIGGDIREGGFIYMAATELGPAEPLPEGLDMFEVPAQRYLVFRQTLGPIGAGSIHPQVVAAVEQIWSKLLPASGYKMSGGPDFEYYPEDFEDKEGKWLEYWIPVKS